MPEETGIFNRVFDPANNALRVSVPTGTFVQAGAQNRQVRDIPRLPVSLPALAAAADIPTVTTSGPGGANTIGAGAIFTAYNVSPVTFLGCSPLHANLLGTDYYQNQICGLVGSGSTPWAIEFDYYGVAFDLYFRNNVGNASRFWIWVDDQPTTAAPVASTANTANSSFFLAVGWGAARMRRVRIYMENADFAGLIFGHADALVATPKPKFALAVVGDSYTAGTNATTALQAFPFTLGRMLGAEVYEAGVAGSGYTNAGTGVAFGNAARTALIGGVAPDWILLAGSINDSAASASTVQAAVTAAISAYHAAAPSAKILVMSVQANSGSMSAANIANDAAVNTAAVAAGALVVARPISEGWITGTGNTGATTGTGNADVFITTDGVHPSQAGHDYYARRLYDDIVPALTA